MAISTAHQKTTADVLIIGAGPVGVTAALDLAARGVDVVLVERRSSETAPVPKANHISSRTMEIFRRLGFASEVRKTGLPADYSNDIVFVTHLTDGHELARFMMAEGRNRSCAAGYLDSDWPTPEPLHHCNQMYFEPVLREQMSGHPRITVLYETEIDDFRIERDGVLATGRNLTRDDAVEIEATYLIGCDGARSMTRKKIGGVFTGVDVLARHRMAVIRAPELLSRLSMRPAWMTWFVTRRFHGVMHALDGRELWCFQFALAHGESDFDSIDLAKALPAALGEDVGYEIVHTMDWFSRRLISDTFSSANRVFTAGDASHIWVPMAGYGMNAGIADVTNLTWKIAGVLKGWADPSILATYAEERRPVTEQVANHVAILAKKNYGANGLFMETPPALFKTGSEGDRERARVGKILWEANFGQFNCLGLNYGYSYADSAIVERDGEPPEFALESYTPSTVPGCRTPHVFLEDGTSLYDHLGPDYTVVRRDPAVDVTPLLAAAELRGVPMQVLDIGECSCAKDLYDHKLVLSRPDQHVAWRGDRAPVDPLALVDRVRGAPGAR